MLGSDCNMKTPTWHFLSSSFTSPTPFYRLMYNESIFTVYRQFRLINFYRKIPSSGLHISDISGRCIMVSQNEFWTWEAFHLYSRSGFTMPGAFKRAKGYLLGEHGNQDRRIETELDWQLYISKMIEMETFDDIWWYHNNDLAILRRDKRVYNYGII